MAEIYSTQFVLLPWRAPPAYQWPDYTVPTGYVAVVRDLLLLANWANSPEDPLSLELWVETVGGNAGSIYSWARKESINPFPVSWEGRLVLNAGDTIGLRQSNILTYTAGYMGGYLLTAP